MPREPVPIDRVLDQPEIVWPLLRDGSPYWPVYRYFADSTQAAATGAPVAADGSLRMPPWFRGDWANERPLLPGVEPILHNPHFERAARALYGLGPEAVLRPQLVYVNLMLPMPADDPGHTDVPAFRGIDREHFPIWLLQVMGHSGLFERWRIRIATAVSWWSGNRGGEFSYWPDGPDAAPRVLRPHPNSALVGENEAMFHRVERVGAPEEELKLDLGRDALLSADGDGWAIHERGRRLARVSREQVRVSISWKARVFGDDRELRLVDSHADDLDLATVVATFVRDLRARGRALAPGPEPLADPGFVAALGQAYTHRPGVWPQ
jgi:hypothetical protein